MITEPDILNQFLTEGARWFIVNSKGGSQAEIDAYSYGGTVVFTPWGQEHIFLVAVLADRADYQIGRWQSGLWGVAEVTDEDGGYNIGYTDTIAMELIGLMRLHERV